MQIGSFMEPVIYSIGLLANLYLAAEVTFFRIIIPFSYLYGPDIAVSCVDLLGRDGQTHLEYSLKGLLFVYDLSDDITIGSVLEDKEGIKFLCNFNFEESIEEDCLEVLKEKVTNYELPYDASLVDNTYFFILVSKLLFYLLEECARGRGQLANVRALRLQPSTYTIFINC